MTHGSGVNAAGRPATRLRELGDSGEQCAWELARGLAKVLLEISHQKRGRCWCLRRVGIGFHTRACTRAQAELSAARLVLGDTTHQI